MTTNSDGEIRIPKWLQSAAAAVLLAAVSWAWQVNATLAEIRTQVWYARQDLDDVKTRLRDVERVEHRKTSKPITP